MARELSFSIAGPQPDAIVGLLAKQGWIPPRKPVVVSIDSVRETSIATDWFAPAWKKRKSDVMASWDDGERLTVFDTNVVSGVQLLDFSAESVLALLAQLRFEVAAFGPVHEDWALDPSSFANNHDSFGWAVAFRGDGHKRIPSRRWLDAGPWRILRAPGDVTLVQFHDLAASAAQAATQAGPGHDLMDAGYVRHPWEFQTDLKGLYDKKSHILIMTVHGREVSDEELQDAVALRTENPLKDGPVDNVAYVFVEPEPAQEHLPRMWLRGLEVRLIDKGKERRIDGDYEPPAVKKPAWVGKLGRDDSAGRD